MVTYKAPNTNHPAFCSAKNVPPTQGGARPEQTDEQPARQHERHCLTELHAGRPALNQLDEQQRGADGARFDEGQQAQPEGEEERGGEFRAAH